MALKSRLGVTHPAFIPEVTCNVTSWTDMMPTSYEFMHDLYTCTAEIYTCGVSFCRWQCRSVFI